MIEEHYLVQKEDLILIEEMIQTLETVGLEDDLERLKNLIVNNHSEEPFNYACKLSIAWMRLATERLNHLQDMQSYGYI